MQSQRIQQLLVVMRVIALMYFVAALAILFQSIFSILRFFAVSSIIGAFWNNPGAAGGGIALIERISSFLISVNTVLLSPFLPPTLIFKTYATSVIAGASLAGGQISFQQYLLNISVFIFFAVMSFGLWKKWKWPLVVAGINASAVIISSVFFLSGGFRFNVVSSSFIFKGVGFYVDIAIIAAVIMFVRAGIFKPSLSENSGSLLNRLGVGSFWSDIKDIRALSKDSLADTEPIKPKRFKLAAVLIIAGAALLGIIAFFLLNNNSQNHSQSGTMTAQNNNSDQDKQSGRQTQDDIIKKTATDSFNYKTTKLGDAIFGSDRDYVYYDSAKRQSFFVLNGNVKWSSTNGEIGELVFSKDYKHFAYTTGKSGKAIAVYDDIESKPYDSIDDLKISGDGEHYAFIAKKDNEYFMVVDGREFKNRYRYIEYTLKEYALSGDGSVVAYLAEKNKGETFFVVNSDETKVKRETEFGLSQEGGLIAYTTQDDNGLFYVVKNKDAVQGGKYKEIWNLTFSPDGRSLAYLAQNEENKVIVVVDNEERATINIGDKIARLVDAKKRDPSYFIKKIYEYNPKLFFSPDGTQLAYDTENGEIIVFNESGKTHYDGTKFSFSPDGKHMSYIHGEVKKAFVIIDGSGKNQYYGVQPPVFSSNGAHYAYIVNDLFEDYIVIDDIEIGKLGLKYDPVSVYNKKIIIYDNPIFSPDSRYVGYLKAINNEHLWWIVHPAVSLSDADNDGLADEEEDRYETDKNNPDTDGDGFKDGEEVRNLFNPKGGGTL